MEKVNIPVKGMHCASCASIIKNSITKIDGVENIDVNIVTEKASIAYDPEKTNIEKMSEKIKPYGYEFITNENSMTQMEDMDHFKHLGLNQNKHKKQLELHQLKRKIQFVMPLTAIIFTIMMWDIFSKITPFVPNFFIPMEILNPILFVLATIVLFWIGKPFILGVKTFIKNRVANMDTLIGIGTTTAYAFSTVILLFPQIAETLNLPDTTYFDVTIVVIGFIVFGKYLEAKSKMRTGEAIEKLLNLQAKTALVERKDQTIEIPIEQVIIGDIVVVKPGGKIPVDGVILEGFSSIDESMITGEAMPIDKNNGDSVVGGTINKQGILKIKAAKVGGETLLSQIIKMVEQAQGSKAPIQKLADTVSSIFVPTVLIIAILTLVTWILVGFVFIPFSQALALGITCFVGILVIACPCALGLATPTAIIVGVGKGANCGILIKNAESLENLHKINTVVVDKTGTITNGKPVFTEMINLSSKSDNELLSILGSLENNSEHPLATALVEKVKNSNIKIETVTDFEIIEGKGLKGKINGTEYFAGNLKLLADLNIKVDTTYIDRFSLEGKSPVLLMDKKQVLAIVAIADTIKETAIEAIKSLHKLGIKVIMLTGDNKNTANFIAKKAGLDDIVAEVLPSEKADKITELQKKGLFVAMAGDGVNDAPALALANVGIAMGTGADIAMESADITLLHGDITKIAQAIKLSKITMKTIKQNLFFAFIYNIVGIPVAAGVLYPTLGITLNPVFAGLAMALSSISVVSNSLRLKIIKI